MRKNIKKYLVSISLLVALLYFPATKSLADNTASGSGCGGFFSFFNIEGSKNLVQGLPQYCTLNDLALKAIDILMTISGTVAVLFLIVGGFWYLTAAGNEETAEKGRKTIINSVIGLVVVIMSYAIVRVIVSLLNLSSGTK